MKSRGFTLIEVLVAMMILTGAMLALSQSWSGSMVRFRKTQDIAIVTSLLKKKAAELEIKYHDLGFSEIPEEESGGFEGDFKDYSWAAKTQELDFPDLSEALVSKDGGANELMLTVVKQMTDYFSKNTKELKVTVTWKSGTREVKYSITTYITNRESTGPQGLPAPPGTGGTGSGSGNGTGGGGG